MTASGLVGREGPLALLVAALDDLHRGVGGVLVITGEAGIGKTSVLRVAVADARASGVLVAAGACWDGAGPGWWPWVQALRSLRAEVSDAAWDAVRQEAGAALGAVLGDGEQHVDVAQPEVFGAVISALRLLARRRPLLVAIEDLHWSDRASLELLGVVGRQVALDPVLVVATARDDEVDAAHPLHDALVALAPTITLSGLDADAVAMLLARAGAASMPAAADVHRRTGGNPFFVEQVATLWLASGASSTPAAVEATIERRLARLPSDTANLLSLAALCGTRLDVALLARLTGLDAARTHELLHPAMSARLVVDDGGAQFAHALVRDVLVDRLDPAQARRWHAALVEHLPRVAPGDPELTTRLAAHAMCAIPEVSPATAAALSIDAARQASRRLAADEAAGHLERALGLLDAGDADAPNLHLELAKELGRAGRLDAARVELNTVLAAAPDTATQARAALGLHELGALLGDAEHDRQLDTLNEALQRLDADGRADDPLTARVLAAIGRAHAHRLDDDRLDIDAATASAVDIARRSGDDATLAFCLLARHDAVWGTTPPVERVTLTRAMEAAARRAGEIELESQAILLQFVVELELADPAAFATLDRYGVLTERAGLGRARYAWLSRQATVATLRGEFDRSAELADEALALGVRIGETDAFSVDIDQRWERSRLRGDLTVIAHAVATIDEPQMVAHDMTLALDSGDVRRAAELLDAIDQLNVRWPRWAMTSWLATSAEVAARCGDLERCRKLREQVARHGAAWVVLGGAVTAQGPIARVLGLLDIALGRWDDALDELEQARRTAERLGARPWVVLTRLSMVEALVGRDGPGDRTDAAQMLDAAREEAAELGMATALRRADELTPAITLDVGATPPNRFVRDGAVWTIEFAGVVQHLPPSKGLRDLHELIARPHHDVTAAALQALADGAPQQTRRGDSVLDDAAKASYRRRLTQLDASIEHALDRHDDERASALDAERDALIAELRAQTGLGGRPRRAGDDVERARKAVTARIRDAMARLAANDPNLGNHLQAAITTGTACRYDPPTTIPWHT